MSHPFFDFHKAIFKNCSKLTNLIIPNFVSSISDSAFYGCSSLTQIVIPSSLISIDSFAFFKCISLVSILIPPSVISIGKFAFSKCIHLTEISIQSSIKSIENSVFSGCSSLKQISIPSSVESLGDYAFFECSLLENVIIPDSVENIGEYCFYDCHSLKQLKIPPSIKSISPNAFDYELSKILNISSQQPDLYSQRMHLIKQDVFELYQTPPQLIEELQNLAGKVLDFKSLKDQVRSISSRYNCIYICFITGPSKKTQEFRCKHYNTSYKCQSFIKYFYDEEKHVFHLDTMNSEHSHIIGQVNPGRNVDTLPKEQKEKIIEYTKLGLSSGRIRILESLYCSPQILYNARRETLKKMHVDEMKLFLDELNRWKNWEYILYNDNDNKLSAVYAFHLPIINSFYSTSVCAVDDTSCTNFFDYYLYVMICSDENNKNQLLAFSLLPDKSSKTISQFFKEVKIRIGNIKTFLTDRSPSQIESIRNIWPEANIIFCAIHIGRNIKAIIGVEILHLYDNMRNGVISEEELINEFRKYITNHRDDEKYAKAVNLLITLLEEVDHWLPSMINIYNHCGNDTTNRVEGFFGNLKTMTDHGILTFHLLIRAIFIIAKGYLNSSNHESQKCIDENIISIDDQSKISNFALLTMLNEYSEIDLGNDDGIEYSQCCCNIKMVYNIPCKHLLRERRSKGIKPLISIADIPLRWIHNLDYQIQIEVKSKIVHKQIDEKDDIDWSYSSLVGVFGKYFSVAKRSPQIRTIFRKMLSELTSVEVETESSTDLRPPNNLPIAGPKKRNPRKNVDHKKRGNKKEKLKALTFKKQNT